MKKPGGHPGFSVDLISRDLSKAHRPRHSGSPSISPWPRISGKQLKILTKKILRKIYKFCDYISSGVQKLADLAIGRRGRLALPAWERPSNRKLNYSTLPAYRSPAIA
jgi:hypothetical protein